MAPPTLAVTKPDAGGTRHDSDGQHSQIRSGHSQADHRAQRSSAGMPDEEGDPLRTLRVTLDDATSALPLVEWKYVDRPIAPTRRPAS